MQGFLRIFPAAVVVFLASASTAFAEGGHKMPLNAESLHDFLPLTNSSVMVWVATLLIVLFCRAAAGKISMVPAGFQNFAEWLIEGLYNFFGSLLGDHLVKKTFWFFGGTFLFILINNWLGLMPGVGTMGWEAKDGSHFTPWFRGGNADLNMTSAMSVVFMTVWVFWALQENGIKGFVAHIFAPKGKFQGIMMKIMVVVFFLVGILEVISILIRPVALSFRLFGNIYGGEQALEKLMELAPANMAFLPALPFCFMEILVGLIQALVFSLLAAIFLNLICDHGDEEHH
ncbi:F0F1 ATP synthase subunit A [Akkermansiaceae bacterium]|nr:F0F1 ATP synthase subunit A [Akkermansiaceae bacterium]